MELVVSLAMQSLTDQVAWSADGERLACATMKNGPMLFDAMSGYASERARIASADSSFSVSTQDSAASPLR